MKSMTKILLFTSVIAFSTSCVSTKKYNQLQTDLQKKLTNCDDRADKYKAERDSLKTELRIATNNTDTKNNQIENLEKEIEDLKIFRDKQLVQVDNLTVLSHKANENITKSLNQLEKKEKYIHLLQNAKTKADSINLVLSLNLKNVLKDNIEDKDINISVDKTVVFINLSDKMLFKSGSSELTPKANEILEKVAKVIKAREDIEVMVEGYTDNAPISNSCIKDNWDLSVKRSTSVVRILQSSYGVDPNLLIAAGRGQYNAIADNKTAEGKATNRRTRIIILPKLNQFYDLLDPDKVPE